jgi:ATP-dependent DNA helicase RecG
LKYLCQTNDGFALSEKDLELRGSGNLLGTEQSGFENEIDSFIGLNPQMYNQIASLIDDLDFLNLDPSKTSLDSLPRLAKFLQTESQKVWEE